MLVQPVSEKNCINHCNPKTNPSFKLRDVYYGYKKEKILTDAFNKFKNELKPCEQNRIKDYILTKYFGWFSPTEVEKPRSILYTAFLGIISGGMSTLTTFIKEENDTEDAEELADIISYRILNSNKN